MVKYVLQIIYIKYHISLLIILYHIYFEIYLIHSLKNFIILQYINSLTNIIMEICTLKLKDLQNLTLDKL